MIKVLIIDDSAIVRQVLSERINSYSDIAVVGTAADPFIGRDKIVRLNPDVITLDIEMPRMDGITFLKKLMDYYPIPVIIISSVTVNDTGAAIKALEIGAFDVVNKPGGSISIEEVATDVVYKIRQAYKIKDSYVTRRGIASMRLIKRKPKHTNHLARIKTTRSFIAIGSSTGGTVALEQILSVLPSFLPPILIVQHMPENYTLSFAKRLDSLSHLKIKESEDGEALEDGMVYIAPGGKHMILKKRGTRTYVKHTQTEKICFQRPSADVLFQSIAEEVGENALGIVLTGMGRDGSEGLLMMRNKGAQTIAQDKESSIVWGMPQAAIKVGAAEKVLSLHSIPQAIVDYALERERL